MKNSHNFSTKEVLDFYNVTTEKGLSKEQVIENRMKFGKNSIKPEDATPFWKLVLKQFDDTLIKILIASAFIDFILAFFEEETGFSAFIEPFVIVTILIVNAVIGIWQEESAEAAIAALKEYCAESATCIRGGEIQTVKTEDLVCGDIIFVSVGDRVPADARIIKLNTTNFRTEQSALTGESKTVCKDEEVVKEEKCQIQSKTNIVFSGSAVAYGKAIACISQVGLDTEIGKIQQKLAKQEEVETPLQKKLDQFGDLLSKVIGVICLVVWVVNIRHFSDPIHGNWFKGAIYYFKISVSLAVAAIPEGLPAVITTCLSLGASRMAKKNAIIRSLPSVETLGCTTIICSDKTGTLTTNKMSVTKAFIVDENCSVEEYDVEHDKYKPYGNIKETKTSKPVKAGDIIPFFETAKVCALCNDSNLRVEKNEITTQGEATELSLRVFTEKVGIKSKDIKEDVSKLSLDDRVMYFNKIFQKDNKRKYLLEFTRIRKSMSVFSEGEILYVKGAYECVLDRCSKILLKNGKIIDLTKEKRKEIYESVRNVSEKYALRCIGCAYKDGFKDFDNLFKNTSPDKFQDIEDNMIFTGICGMIDPPREEVKPAIRNCKTAGIRVMVITGDNKNTAIAICKDIGVFDQNEDTEGKAFTGAEFDELNSEEKEKAVKNAKLFSRVEPHHKDEIIEILVHKQGEIAAMTGDGVNDANALKAAHIGIAMGSGTAVAKDASKMVLQDDSFASIVSAVEEGRGIFNNTKSFIRYLISSNIGEVVCIFFTSMLGLPDALIPVQLLFVNLVTDGLPATALGFNPKEDGIMSEKPRDPHEPIVSSKTFLRYFVEGSYIGLATVFSFVFWYQYLSGYNKSLFDLMRHSKCIKEECEIFEDHRGKAVAVSTLVVCEMFNALSCISEYHSVFTSMFNNFYLIGSVFFSMIIHMAILYIPIFNKIFFVAPLNVQEWMLILVVSFPIIIIEEVFKMNFRFQKQKSKKEN